MKGSIYARIIMRINETDNTKGIRLGRRLFRTYLSLSLSLSRALCLCSLACVNVGRKVSERKGKEHYGNIRYEEWSERRRQAMKVYLPRICSV